MEKTYKTPQLEIVALSICDIVTVSLIEPCDVANDPFLAK